LQKLQKKQEEKVDRSSHNSRLLESFISQTGINVTEQKVQKEKLPNKSQLGMNSSKSQFTSLMTASVPSKKVIVKYSKDIGLVPSMSSRRNRSILHDAAHQEQN
jgi:hypothetical protein